MSLKLNAKKIRYVLDIPVEQYTYVLGKKPEDYNTGNATANDITGITNGMEALRLDTKNGYTDWSRWETYNSDQAKVLYFFSQALDEEDAVLIDELYTAAAVWEQLKKKYTKTVASSVTTYTSKIITFKYDEERGIDSCWAQLKEYRRKLGSADKAMKSAYLDPTLFVMFSRSLPEQFTGVLDGFLSQENMDVDTKIRKLAEKEDMIKSVAEERANAAWKSKKEANPKRRGRRSSSSSTEDMNCFLCNEKHLARDCPYAEKFRDFLKKSQRDRTGRSSSRSKEAKERSESKSGKRVKFDKSRQYSSKSSKALPVHEKSELEDYDSDSEGSGDEHCNISKDELSKHYHSTAWAADTGASSHMAYQPECFRSLIPIRARRIQVGGGVLYARHKGVAEQRCADGSYAVLSECLFVPDLGINLLSARRLCRNGITGFFDDKHMYFRRQKKTIVKATMSDGLYWVTHVESDKKKETAFSATDVRMGGLEEETNQSHHAQLEESTSTESIPVQHTHKGESEKNSKPLTVRSARMPMTDAAIEQYKLYHRRFSHLGPKKLQYLHEVTTLRKPISIPYKAAICEVCSLTKIRNSIPKELSPWKTAILALIQFDVAGPFPASIAGNKYFLLIVDSATRKEWVIPMPSKTSAIEFLRTWKNGVERQTEKKIKQARSDNAPELLKVMLGWKVDEGIEAQSTTISSSHQNGPAERNIQTAEADMRAMLQESNLPIEFWDEAVMADSYVRNRTYNKLKIEGVRVCPEGAFTGVIPSIDHIRVWGSKCYYYENKKSTPKADRHDKLINPGRVGVFMGYEQETTKHFRVYSPEHGYVIRRSVIRVDEDAKGGTVDLRIRGIPGNQGTPNVVANRKPKGRPKKDTNKGI
jgi:hypothetical protein